MTTYAIVFKGELRDGFVRDAVMAAFQARANLNEKQIEQVFSGRTVTLKKGLTRDEAKQFARDLRTLGMRVIAAAPPGAPPARKDAADDGEGTYRIRFSGEVVEGFEREAVMLTAGKRLKFSDKQRDLLFSGREVTMKRNLPEDKARHYLDTLRKLGMNAQIDPPLPVVADDPVAQAAEASLVETQFAQPTYNFEDTFHSSSTLDAAEGLTANDVEDIHPSLRTQPQPTTPPPNLAEHAATVINDDIVNAYKDQLSGPDVVDPAIDALRANHDPDPSAPPPPADQAVEPEPQRDATDSPAEAAPDVAPPPLATTAAPAENDEDAYAAAGPSRTEQRVWIAAAVFVLAAVAVIAWWVA